MTIGGKVSLPPLEERRHTRLGMRSALVEVLKSARAKTSRKDTPYNQQAGQITVQESGARARAIAPALRLKRASRLGAKRGKAWSIGRGGVVKNWVA